MGTRHVSIDGVAKMVGDKPVVVEWVSPTIMKTKEMKMKRKIRFVARALKSRFLRDRGEIACLLKSLKKGSVAVDIGANKGQYTYWMLKSVGSEGQVVAFEPQPVLANYLNDVKVMFNYKQLTIEQCGLSSEESRKTLVIPQVGKTQSPLATFESTPQEGFESYQVDVDTMDHYFSQRPQFRPLRFIKCDVEGHEFNVIKGGLTVIKEDKPDILFECEIRHLKTHTINEIFKLLEDIGYTGSFILGEKVIPLKDFDPLVHQVFGQKPYANNFIFRF